MASTQKQKTTSGGSVTGLLNAAWPGSPVGVASLAIMRVCLKALRPLSSSRPVDACSRFWLRHCPKRPHPYTFLDRYTNPSAHKKSQLLLHEYLSTHPCIDCSRNNILVLEFDHVHGSKKANVAAMARDERPWSTIQAEINKCEVRCANCHRIKTLDRIGSWRSLYGK